MKDASKHQEVKHSEMHISQMDMQQILFYSDATCT